MNVASSCRALRLRFENHLALRRQNKVAETFRSKTADVRAIRQNLADLLAKVRVLRTRNVPGVGAVDGTGTLAVVREYEAKVGPEMSDNGVAFGLVKKSLNHRVKVASDALAAALESMARGVPKYDEPFLKRVEAIPKYAGLVARIRLSRDAVAAAGRRPAEMTAEELDNYLEKRENLVVLIENLHVDEFPSEVLEFFAAARRGAGAPYDKLTDPVKAWLAEHNLLKNIKIVISDN